MITHTRVDKNINKTVERKKEQNEHRLTSASAGGNGKEEGTEARPTREREELNERRGTGTEKEQNLYERGEVNC